MAQATEQQKLQLIAKLSTATDRRKWDGSRLQICMEDPTFDDRFAAFINSSEKPVEVTVVLESLIIKLSDLPEPKFPDASKGCVLIGAKGPTVIDISKLIETFYLHERQTGNQACPTGHEILASLVKSYKFNEDEVGKTYCVEPDDAINGHYGLKELFWLEQNWKTIPEEFRSWAAGKLLFGYRDIVRSSRGELHSPYLCSTVNVSRVCWCHLDAKWEDNEFGLREQAGAQV